MKQHQQQNVQQQYIQQQHLDKNQLQQQQYIQQQEFNYQQNQKQTEFKQTQHTQQQDSQQPQQPATTKPDLCENKYLSHTLFPHFPSSSSNTNLPQVHSENDISKEQNGTDRFHDKDGGSLEDKNDQRLGIFKYLRKMR